MARRHQAIWRIAARLTSSGPPARLLRERGDLGERLAEGLRPGLGLVVDAVGLADRLHLGSDLAQALGREPGEEVVLDLVVETAAEDRERTGRPRKSFEASTCIAYHSPRFVGARPDRDSSPHLRRRDRRRSSPPSRCRGSVAARKLPSITFQKNGPASSGEEDVLLHVVGHVLAERRVERAASGSRASDRGGSRASTRARCPR